MLSSFYNLSNKQTMIWSMWWMHSGRWCRSNLWLGKLSSNLTKNKRVKIQVLKMTTNFTTNSFQIKSCNWRHSSFLLCWTNSPKCWAWWTNGKSFTSKKRRTNSMKKSTLNTCRLPWKRRLSKVASMLKYRGWRTRSRGIRKKTQGLVIMLGTKMMK